MITRKKKIEKSDRFDIALMKMNKKSFSNSVSTLTRKGGYKHIANGLSLLFVTYVEKIDIVYFCGQNFTRSYGQ